MSPVALYEPGESVPDVTPIWCVQILVHVYSLQLEESVLVNTQQTVERPKGSTCNLYDLRCKQSVDTLCDWVPQNVKVTIF